MNILFLDYETYYDDEYSLSKIKRTIYLNDPRFKVHGAAVAIDDSSFEWLNWRHLQQFFNDCKGLFDAMCCFNGLFDHGITAKCYLPEEKFLLDAMSMARGVLSTRFPDLGMSLDAVAKHFFPDNPSMHKQLGVLDNFKGVREPDAYQEQRLGSYARQDGYVMRSIFRRLLEEDYPWSTALTDIHLTLAMGVYPQLRMNTLKAAAIHGAEVKAKEQAAKDLGIARAGLRSAEAVADLLRSQGVEPPTKYSEKQQKHVYAFASKDEDFKALLEHDNPAVRAIVETRLGEKSAQSESRAKLFAQLPVDLPIPLGYAKAHTGRHGGEEFNMQNLGRGSALRDCVGAPEGCMVLVRDLAQIELRMNAWWCGEQWLVDLLVAGGDPYCVLATKIFGRTITKADEFERFVGKQGELSCGYGSGWAKAHSSLRGNGVDADEQLARSVVKGYRDTHLAIVGMWETLQKVAMPEVAGYGQPFEHKGVRFEHGRVVLPSGRSLWYPELHVNEDGDWVYRVNKRRNKGQEWKKIFGGALLENCIQALSYDVFMLQARLVWHKYGLRPAMAVHDELVYVVPADEVEEWDQRIAHIQTIAPSWAEGLPLKGEGGWGRTYLEAK